MPPARRTPALEAASELTSSSHRPSFDSLGLVEALVRAVRDEGYEQPTAIQGRAIPHVLAGKDLLGVAQTGTGKTAAFVLPILQRLLLEPYAGDTRRRPVRALILSPTRELASQIARACERYGAHTRLRHTVIYGGVGQTPQVNAVNRGVDILVATPGRLCDLMAQGLVRLGQVEVLVLDEADRMLDQGFLPDVTRIIDAMPTERQTLLFSATMPKEIQDMAARALRSPVMVEVAPIASTPDMIEQTVYHVDQANKRDLLDQLLMDEEITRAIVFTRTKHGADRVAKQLARSNVRAAAIHGNKSQNARERSLASFRDGVLRVLVATDVAARGIDVDGISHVINYDIPQDPESYVHRIGRTARAGASGAALSFCSAEERGRLASIERLTKRRIPVAHLPPYTLADIRPVKKAREADDRRPMAKGTRPAREVGGERAPSSRRSAGSRPGSRSASSERSSRSGQSRRTSYSRW